MNEDYIRLETEEPFESHTAYARNNRPVYGSVYMRNEPIARLGTNTKLTVLEAKNGWVFVEWTDGKGFMKEEDISTRKISTGGGSNSGGSSAPADGTDVDVGSLSATTLQGGVALLGAYHGPEMEAGFEKCKGTILADEIEAYITVFGYGAEMKVVAYDDAFCTVYLGTDLMVKIPRAFVKLESDNTEEEFFAGYSRSKAVVYKEYQCRSEYKKMGFNESVNVLYKLPALSHDGEEIYAVSIDGEVMYMLVSTVSQTKLKASSGSSSSSSGSADVWTPPQL